ncbi:MAG: asparagine synthase (glutamine-hydrolyzing) [Candidatus Methylomirabilis oxyfera]|nr:asparagine synthase (glutamine-hydrolyzing) [Candidatus Methylomirabilis oxyfera]
MCGIAGCLDARGARGADSLAATGEAMAATLRHRGPDGAGVWIDPAVGIALAHRRLAILDLSPAGRQPMVSSCGRFVLTYNGEIYNYVELRDALVAAGRPFRGHSDTEVLVEACAEWGVEATLRRLLGMFAFAVWDRTTRMLMLARDRIGIKPLYWARFGTLLLFGSELKALRAHDGWTPEIDRDSLAAFVRYGHVPAPYSIYRGVSKLLPGELLVVGPDGEPRISSYWDPARIVAAAQSERLDISEAEAVDDLEWLLGDAVVRHMAADVPLGAFLSGGIDSSLVVALMQAHSNRPINTFTIAFREERFNEADHARAVANHLGTAHTELLVSPRDALDLIPELPRWYDEPFGSRSQIPTMLVSRLARRQVTVALSGDGGDELFGGYKRYYATLAVARKAGSMPRLLRDLAANAVDDLFPAVRALHGIVPAAIRPNLPLNWMTRITAVARASGDVNALHRQLRSFNVEPSTLLVPGAVERPARWQTTSHVGAVSDPMERLGYFELLTVLVDSILTKVDRASMAHSLEVRVPILDHRVVEYAWRLPPALKFGTTVADNKPLLRRLLYRYVPRDLVDRRKHGFQSPIAVWLRSPLRTWAEELLDERRLKENGFFEPALVRRCWNEHLRGTGDHWKLLWDVLMFQQWYEYWVIGRDCAFDPAGA